MDKLSKYFLLNLFLIILVGIIMVYSSSYIYAKEVMGSSVHFLIKQVTFLIFGTIFAFILSKTKFQFWVKNSYAINIAITLLLLITLTPLGVSIKGSSRWLNIVGFTIQPGEFIKYSALLAATKYFNSFKDYTKDERIKYLAILLTPLILLIIQPDFGTFSILISLILFACFLSDFPRKYFYGVISLSFVGVFGILFTASYRVKRLLTFLDPWSDPQNSGFQIIQSYLAFANGHIFGAGIGNSNEKLFYLPEAYNDFIFSVLGEELGFLGVVFVVLLFISFIYFGLKMALESTTKMNSNFVATVIFSLGLQALLNMGVVLGLLPTKGLNLPFISYGGSSLVANLMAIGLIFSAKNLKSQTQDSKETQASHLHSYFNNHKTNNFETI